MNGNTSHLSSCMLDHAPRNKDLGEQYDDIRRMVIDNADGEYAEFNDELVEKYAPILAQDTK